MPGVWTMKLQLLSDLHLEVHPNFVPQAAPDADVLVLAGDIGSYQPGSLLQGEYFGLERFANWPCPVIFVPGNHEYDMQDWDAAHARLRRVCEELGIIWLERETVVLHGVRFVGTTLWTDYDAIALLDEQVQAGDMSRLLRLREKSFRAANFYLQKTGGTRHGEPFLAAPMREQALGCQNWLRQALDELLPRADLWLHGHLHAPSDYVVQGEDAERGAWRCRVVANPLGYARKGEQRYFQPATSLAV